MKQYGVDVDAMQASGQIPPSLQMPPEAGAGTPPPPSAGTPDDVTARLKRVDDLAAQGLLTEEEHREQRQRIIDSI
jgi:hypothetical protein